LGYEVEVRVVDEKSSLREAVVKVRGKIVAVIPFRDEDSLKRILELLQGSENLWLINFQTHWVTFL
jgi:hypothetical protein